MLIPYYGSKRVLLPTLKKHFPTDIKHFYDLFTGGCNVILNIDCENRIANDIDKNVIELYKFIQEKELFELIENIEIVYKIYKIKDGYIDKEMFEQLLNDLNITNNPILFYMYVLFGFRNMIKYDKNGLLRNAYSTKIYKLKTAIKNISKFKEKITNVQLMNVSYDEIEIEKDGFVYVDPPYTITKASYNKFWNSENDLKLFEYLDNLNSKGIKFMLSNVTHHNNKTNDELIEWSKKYKTINIDKNYNSQKPTHLHNVYEPTQEVIIINY